jgi:hypothetical protein
MQLTFSMQQDAVYEYCEDGDCFQTLHAKARSCRGRSIIGPTRKFISIERLHRIRSTEELDDLIGNRTRDLEACRTVPQQERLPLAPVQNAACPNLKLCVRITEKCFNDMMDIN